MRKVLIGADGGGTKTKLIAVDAKSGKRLAEALTGSINSFFLGMESAVENLRQGIRDLQLEPEDRILAVSLGDPAMDDSSPEDGKAFRDAVRSQLFPEPEIRIFSKSDVFMALYAASKGMPAAFLVAGTGSMGVGLTEPYVHGQWNAMTCVGGWGLPSTDPGSGNDIAIQGITAAMDGFDGVGPKTMLCQKVLAFYQVSQPRELIPVFNGDAGRTEIAAFARCVAECAEAGDEVSLRILRRAGRSLGLYGCSLLEKMQGEEQKLFLYGSVLVNNETVREELKETVLERYPKAVIAIPDLPPEYGAVKFAADEMEIYWEDEDNE